MKELLKEQKLKICHFPQIQMKKYFEVDVKNLEEAQIIMDTLANYDLFEYKNKIKPDYSNMTILKIWDEEANDWLEWMDEETGISNLDEYINFLKEDN